MDILADTNILIRRINRYDTQHKAARTALKVLEGDGHRVCIVPQNIVECWTVATRPLDRNGLGLLPRQIERIVARIEDAFHMLPEKAGIYSEWKRLVGLHSVSGLKVYDARLVASAFVYGIEALLTFNDDDFRRYPGVTILHQRDIIQNAGEQNPKLPPEQT
jgi:predicted nucleic acid-binding protein